MFDSFVFQQNSDRLNMELKGFDLAPSISCNSFDHNFQQAFVF